MRVFNSIDVTALLPLVRCPTLVIHSMLASVHQAYAIAWTEEDSDVVRLRDEWRVMLMHHLGGVGIDSVRDAATVSGTGTDPLPVDEFVDELAGLAEYTPAREAIIRVAEIAGCPTRAVRRSGATVRRGALGNRGADVFEITDPAVSLDSTMALGLLSELARLLPDEDYLRVNHTPSRTVAFADYELGVGLWVDPGTDEEVEFEPPGAASRSWDYAVERLQALAA